MAEVYWIRLPEHTDVFSQGYVGVTGRTAKDRFAEHIKDCNRACSSHYHFYRALRKYEDKVVVVSTLIVGEEDYCYLMENKLRPENYIGWNMAAGGQRPLRDPNSYGDEWKEKLRQHNLGKEHSQETLDKLSSLSKSNWEREEYLLRMREINSSNRVPEKTTERFWKYGIASSQLISRADEIWEEYQRDSLIFSREVVANLGADLTDGNIQFVTKTIRKFNGGWNPTEDPLWLRDFKGIEPPLYYKFPDSWNRRGRGDNSHWAYASSAFEMYLSGSTAGEVGRRFKRDPRLFYKMFERFKDGWVPKEDPRWLHYMETECQKT